ncbi:uncharacterized protein LACBIDRAFT_329118 [Laccaria bicolor S238N-H82]|uniref:Predicted protein n=1 Tax=Laccaria bicolor (strain S238N-H82 / ATCC MYA-4686) TaxID=486041 RepID=B0DH48_LACBS|nr:uncharacterized protein LACBIDRAFT_329118 [Laccaria bicolor S238N-H82]EDR05951.1 predicted protein [Laccaria bicolor S238N-H82]|eukprot:XP_001883239.1 predicted protein [Laccaria bicolor S238N-H82]
MRWPLSSTCIDIERAGSCRARRVTAVLPIISHASVGDLESRDNGHLSFDGIPPNSRNVCPFSVVRIHPQLVVAIDCRNIANTNVPIADWALIGFESKNWNGLNMHAACRQSQVI